MSNQLIARALEQDQNGCLQNRSKSIEVFEYPDELLRFQEDRNPMQAGKEAAARYTTPK